MKKTLFAVLALAAVAACNKAEVVEQNPANAIAFDNVFVDNATKSVADPSYTNTNLFSDFAVFGFVEGATLFDGVKVSGSALNSKWTYTDTQYWIAGANYNFHAIAPETNKQWKKAEAAADGVKLSFTNNGTQDVLYASAAEEGKASGNETVKFSFRHILSKVKFSFENGYNATKATIRVRDINITNAYVTGKVALNTNTVWSEQVDKLTLAFGNAAIAAVDAEEAFAYGTTVESYNELLLIPGAINGGYEVKFDVDLLVSGTVVKTYKHTALVNFAPAPGTCYDIKAVINATNIDPEHAQEPIEFTVKTINGWENPADGDDDGTEPDQPNAEIQ